MHPAHGARAWCIMISASRYRVIFASKDLATRDDTKESNQNLVAKPSLHEFRRLTGTPVHFLTAADCIVIWHFLPLCIDPLYLRCIPLFYLLPLVSLCTRCRCRHGFCRCPYSLHPDLYVVAPSHCNVTVIFFRNAHIVRNEVFFFVPITHVLLQ
ncbi:hypothetical protein P153DRAFT_145773 [Dothidotthia symphoricarpi CBS 119687]|uniref:Uncharacterized protein n=1 Tax=Dothidotthia symphoricarpi CBS 119687 TaxID=1392245 RepID=A0A6A5ZY09_9PLEO|nr:uncharacterized protein P153DRAFT_145773 [Dothidotthia symphoricarpi CBS 119687]KAF2123763.1 hypothetical protein P153DRAFT_145773 [Dothidotthia symphoricarpi CBS 119687]